MEHPSMEWQIDDCSSEENSGRVNSILSKGLKWGKNILVTGVMVSSAPIVLPPLVVISAFGLFCSIPYGFFLASHACTEKIMSMLLNSELPYDYEQIKGYEETDWQIEGLCDDFDLQKEDPVVEEDKGQGIEMVMINEDPDLGVVSVQYESIAAGEDFEELVKQVDQFTEESEHKGDFGNHVDENYGKSLEESERVMKEVAHEQPIGEISAAAIEIGLHVGLSEISETKEDEELVRETKGLIEQLKAEGEKQNAVEDDKLAKQKAGRRKKKISKKSDEKINVAEKTNTIPTAEVRPTNEMVDSSKKKNVQNVAATNKSIASTNESQKVGNVAKKYPKPVVERGAVPKQDQAENNLGTRKLGNDSAQGKREHESSLISLDKDASDKGKVVSEKKIWEQIRAMRTIVGYKATAQDSIVEELKALYLFTGVEPPSSFIDASDMVEIGDKLGFLMSIVGVK